MKPERFYETYYDYPTLNFISWGILIKNIQDIDDCSLYLWFYQTISYDGKYIEIHRITDSKEMMDQHIMRHLGINTKHPAWHDIFYPIIKCLIYRYHELNSENYIDHIFFAKNPPVEYFVYVTDSAVNNLSEVSSGILQYFKRYMPSIAKSFDFQSECDAIGSDMNYDHLKELFDSQEAGLILKDLSQLRDLTQNKVIKIELSSEDSDSDSDSDSDRNLSLKLIYSI